MNCMNADDLRYRAVELRGIAAELRRIPYAEGWNQVYKEGRLGRYLSAAFEKGAFDGAKWVRLKTDAQHTFGLDGLSFVSMSEWLKQNASDVNLEIDQTRGNGDIEYWATVWADLIDQEAQAKDDTAAKMPRNWWLWFNQWWQHRWWAALAVLLFVALGSARGVIALINDILGSG